MSRLHARLAALEARQPERDLLTPHALDRMTGDELALLKALLLDNGNPARTEDLPPDALALIEIASQRQDPAPWPSSSPAYAAWAEHVRPANPATAGLPAG